MRPWRRFVVGWAIVVSGSTLVACVPVPPAPPLGQLPPISSYVGTDCLKVLVVGDSIARIVGPRFEGLLERSGRCVDLVIAARSGSAVVDWLPGRFDDLPTWLEGTKPDVVFAFFVGNESWGPYWSNPTWVAQTKAAALQLVDLVPPDVALYWGLPARVAWRCEWGSVNDQRWVPWHAWIRDSLRVQRPSVRVVDWRTTFGGETHQQRLRFPDGITRNVFTSDCVHYSSDGADVAAHLAVAAMQDEWTVPAPATTTTTSTTSSTTSTTSSTTTTTTTDSTTTTTVP